MLVVWLSMMQDVTDQKGKRSITKNRWLIALCPVLTGFSVKTVMEIIISDLQCSINMQN